MSLFNDVWSLLRAHGSSSKREKECAELWAGYSLSMQQRIYDAIRVKLSQKKFVHYDPLRAIQENAEALSSQTLSYAEYYRRYGTTEERDGWHMENPTGQQVIYVKQSINN